MLHGQAEQSIGQIGDIKQLESVCTYFIDNLLDQRR